MVTDKRRENMNRRQAVNKLLAARDGALVVTGLGSPSYDVHAHGDAANNYYLWGAMGGAALTGLGLAQAQPEKRVMVITGDGEQLMAFGSLATIAVAKPANLVDWSGQKSPIWDSDCTQNVRFRRMRTGISFTVSLSDRLRLQAIVAAPRSLPNMSGVLVSFC